MISTWLDRLATVLASWIGASADPQPVDGGPTYSRAGEGSTGLVHNRPTSMWTKARRRDREPVARRARALWTTIVLALMVVACAPESGKYHQTWAEPYDQTDCLDWIGRLDDHQRFVAAGDILITLRKRDGDASMPPDQTIDAFGDGIGELCRARSGDVATSILELGPLVYIAYPDRFKP